MAFLAPLFLAGLAAVAIPIFVHLIERERKDVIAFPSLMFFEKIPYQSVERRRIHNWLLLLLRAAAMILIIAAFSRPFLTEDLVQAAGTSAGAREVVILLDRSASMGYGDHWDRARDEALEVVAGLDGNDQGTLVLFGTGAQETVRATSNKASLEAAISSATVSAEATRFAPALRLAQSLLLQSALPRGEVVLISDFQRSGWARREEVELPEGATLRAISVATPGTADVSVNSAVFQRGVFSGQERVGVVAGLTNRSAIPVVDLAVTLEFDGRAVETRRLSIDPGASGSVTFPAVTVSDTNMRGTITIGDDDLAANNVFRFVLSPSRPVSVLIIQGEGTSTRGATNPSLYLTTALETSEDPPFEADVVTAARVTADAFEHRSVVVLNDSTSLSTEIERLIEGFVTQGGGVMVALGDRTPWGQSSPLMPGVLGGAIDRPTRRGGSLGFLDYSHPIFDVFKDPRNGNFANVRFFRYRGLTPADTDRVLARFDDGAVALAERRVGAGSVLVWTTTLDDSWNDFSKQPLFVPVMHEAMRYLAQYEEPESWHTVGRVLDVAAPIAAAVREGAVGATAGDTRELSGVVLTPSGDQVAFGQGGLSAIDLSEQGFYTVRMQGSSERRPFSVAVNLDPAESDLSALPPQDFAASATGQAAAMAGPGQSLERPELTAADMEQRRGIWWFLFVAGAMFLIGEAVLSNRLSARASRRPAGVVQTLG